MQKMMQDMLDQQDPQKGGKPGEEGQKKLSIKLQQSEGDADKG